MIIMNTRIVKQNYALDISKNVITDGQVSDAKAINQSIESILMTGRDERIFEDYGSFVPSLIFTNINKNTAVDVMDGISSLLNQYEKRIALIPSECKLKILQAQNALDITLVYIIVATNTVGEFNKRLIF